MKKIILVVLLVSCVTSYADNLGHRLGKKAFTNLPENSIEIYKKLIRATELHKDIEYIEFDVQELKTGELIVFHDSNFKHGFRPKFKKKVYKSSYSDIKDLCLKKSPKGSCYKIPMVKEILEESKKLEKKIKVLIEIKKITDAGKDKLIFLMNSYKEDVDMDIIIGNGRFNKMFSKKWCSDFNNAGYSIMQTHVKKDPRKNNLCNS